MCDKLYECHTAGPEPGLVMDNLDYRLIFTDDGQINNDHLLEAKKFPKMAVQLTHTSVTNLVETSAFDSVTQKMSVGHRDYIRGSCYVC